METKLDEEESSPTRLCEPHKMEEITVLSVEEKQESKQRCTINKKLLPLKCHYFLDSAAGSCIEPFSSIFAKQLGISASSVGIVQSITPLLALISNPLLGGITDHFQKLKITMLIVMLLRGLSSLIIPFTPVTFIDVLNIEANLTCSKLWTFKLAENLSSQWQCLAKQSFSCIIECTNCSYSFVQSQFTQMTNPVDPDNFTMCQIGQLNISPSSINSHDQEFVISMEETSCFTNFTTICTLACPCINNCCSTSSDLMTLQFWLFLIMRIIYTVFGTMTITLTDAACYELLEGKIGHYGRQRLFASLGWGIFSFITGILMDTFSLQGKTNFSIGVFVMAGLVVVDFLAILQIPVKTLLPSQNIMKDIGSLFTSVETIVFMTACVICGGLESINTFYLFWYLEDLGATKTLVSLTLTVNTLLSEIPLFIFTGAIIKRIGNYLCVVIVLLVFCLRHVCYSLIYNPWLAMPIALCHGINFSLFYASMTSYAKISAKKGTEATMQGLLGGLYRGLGQAIGCLLAGYSFDKYGGRMTFRISGTVAGLSGTAMFLIYLLIRFIRKRNRKKIELDIIELT